MPSIITVLNIQENRFLAVKSTTEKRRKAMTNNATPEGTYAETYRPLEGNHMDFIDARKVTDILNHAVGRMLTIAEASITDRQQRDAAKELIKESFYKAHEEAFAVRLPTKSIEFSIGVGVGTRLIQSPLAYAFTGPQMLG